MERIFRQIRTQSNKSDNSTKMLMMMRLKVAILSGITDDENDLLNNNKDGHFFQLRLHFINHSMFHLQRSKNKRLEFPCFALSPYFFTNTPMLLYYWTKTNLYFDGGFPLKIWTFRHFKKIIFNNVALYYSSPVMEFWFSSVGTRGSFCHLFTSCLETRKKSFLSNFLKLRQKNDKGTKIKDSFKNKHLQNDWEFLNIRHTVGVILRVVLHIV